MSINIVNPAPKIQPFVGIERANGYNSGVAIAWDSGWRIFNPGYIRLYASGTDFALVDKWGENIGPSATFTQITAPSSGALSNVYDKNESTSATWSVAASATTDLFSFDLGAQKTLFINIVAMTGNIGGTFYIYGSNDNSTWTQIGSFGVTTSKTNLFIYNNYRYYKVSFSNPQTVTVYAIIYEVEAWNPGNTLKTFNTTTITQLLALVNNAFYRVLEVVYP